MADRFLPVLCVFCVLMSPYLTGQGQTGDAAQGPSTREQIEQLKAVLAAEIKHRNEANLRLWNGLGPTLTAEYNLYLGHFFGRSEEYAKLQNILGDAGSAFDSGDMKKGFSDTLRAFKLVKDLASEVGGNLSPSPYTKIPSNPQEAMEFLQEAVKQLGADGKAYLQGLGTAGDTMQEVESINANVTMLKQQLAELEGKQANEDIIAKETLRPAEFIPPDALSPDERDARQRNEAIVARETLGDQRTDLDAPILFQRWHDLGDRAFSSLAERNAFYDGHPELQKYSPVAAWMSPATDVDQDLSDGSLNLRFSDTGSLSSGDVLTNTDGGVSGSDGSLVNLLVDRVSKKMTEPVADSTGKEQRRAEVSPLDGLDFLTNPDRSAAADSSAVHGDSLDHADTKVDLESAFLKMLQSFGDRVPPPSTVSPRPGADGTANKCSSQEAAAKAQLYGLVSTLNAYNRCSNAAVFGRFFSDPKKQEVCWNMLGGTWSSSRTPSPSILTPVSSALNSWCSCLGPTITQDQRASFRGYYSLAQDLGADPAIPACPR